MTAQKKIRSRLPKIIRIFQARPKLIVSVLLGIATAAVLPPEWRLTTRALIGWDAGITFYLTFVYWTLARSHVSHIMQHAVKEDEGRGVILVLTVAAAMASIAAILALLGRPEGKANSDSLQLMLAVVTIFLSWALIQSIFAVHYAYEFYTEGRPAAGLDFPGQEKPDYWDFVYFSFVVGMTF